MSLNELDNYTLQLEKAAAFHGEVCAGIAIGTRMTMSGLKRIGISEPFGKDRKKMMVFVEIDRCATDAIMALTGCRPGKRTMKIRDFGKMAATFINLETQKAVRLVAAAKRPDAGEAPPDFATMAEDELFSITEVSVPLLPEDLPGKPLRKVVCERCGESVMDGREREMEGHFFCQACFVGDLRYYNCL